MSNFFGANVFVPLSGNAKIIQLAQKVARKNRQHMDRNDNNSRWKTIDTPLATIDANIVAASATMRGTDEIGGYTLAAFMKSAQAHYASHKTSAELAAMDPRDIWNEADVWQLATTAAASAMSK